MAKRTKAGTAAATAAFLCAAAGVLAALTLIMCVSAGASRDAMAAIVGLLGGIATGVACYEARHAIRDADRLRDAEARGEAGEKPK